MSTVLVLTPIIIGSWPAISSAVVGAATALGFLAHRDLREITKENIDERQVEVELSKSSVGAENVNIANEMVLSKGDIEIRVRTDERNRCVICAKGRGYSDEQLKEVADEFAGKLTQIYTYNKVMSELRNKGFQVTAEEMMKDDSIRINVRQNIE